MENVDNLIDILCKTLCEKNEQMSSQNLAGLTQAITNLEENKEIFLKERQEIDWGRFRQKLENCIQKQIDEENTIEGKIALFRNIADNLDKMLEVDFFADVKELNKWKQASGMCQKMVDLMEIILDGERKKSSN